MTKYEIIDQVSRFIKRFGMLMDPETMAKAKEEAGAYDFRLISPGHYGVIHGSKMYVIIERQEAVRLSPQTEIGCSCEDMTFNHQDGTCCKHIIAFSRLMTPVTKPIDKLDAAHLMNVCGWTGRDLHPEEIQIPPDPDLDIGVGDPLPEPEPEPETSVKCQYCKMGFTGQTQEKADTWLREHEATCQKRPKARDIPPEESDSTTEPGMITAECRWCGKKFKRTNMVNLQAVVKDHEEYCEKKPELGEPGAVIQESCEPEPEKEETKMSEDKPAWNQEAWDSATQGSFATFDDNGVAILIFTTNDFEIGKPDKWGRATYEFSVIQNSTAVIFSVGSIRMMNALKSVLPLEGKQIKIIRIGEGTGTQYRVDDITDAEVIE